MEPVIISEYILACGHKTGEFTIEEFETLQSGQVLQRKSGARYILSKNVPAFSYPQPRRTYLNIKSKRKR